MWTFDAAGRETDTTFDDSGRVTQTIQNVSTSTGPDLNVTTTTSYNAAHLLASTAVTTVKPDRSGTQTQTTQYVYGTDVGNSSPAIYSHDIVRAVIYADSTNSYNAGTNTIQNGSSGVYNRVQYTYDRQGEMTSLEDQDQTTHSYAYDGAGRLLSDTAAVAVGNPKGIDTSVASIDYAYKVCGKLLSVSSEDASSNVLNQVYYQYDPNGNLQKQYQEHAGSANMADGNSLYVAYGYDSAANGYRPTTRQYPTSSSSSPGRTLTYQYGDATDPNGMTNRLGSIYDSAEGGRTIDQLRAYPIS